MNTNRAMSILSSPDTVNVFYNNASVWIQSVNGDTASVKFIGSNKIDEVPVRDLVEGSLLSTI